MQGLDAEGVLGQRFLLREFSGIQPLIGLSDIFQLVFNLIRLILGELKLVREELYFLALLLIFDLKVSLDLVKLVVLEFMLAETAHILLRYALDLVDLLTVGLDVLLGLLHQRAHLPLMLLCHLAFLRFRSRLHLGLLYQHPFLQLIQVFLLLQAHLVHQAAMIISKLVIVGHQLLIGGLRFNQSVLHGRDRLDF